MQIHPIFYKFLRGVRKKNFFVPKNKKISFFGHVRKFLEKVTCQIFFFFFYFWGRKIFFSWTPPKFFVEKQGYLHTLDHHPIKNMNYFPYNFENVTFGSTKPKKYIFENIGKIIHEKDQKNTKNMAYFLKNTTFGRELFSLYFQICIF